MPEAIADPSERLPWLSEPARPQPRQPRRSWLPLAVAVSAVGAIAFGGWAVVQQSGTGPQIAPVETGESIALPPPRVVSQSDASPQPPSTAEREALRPAVQTSMVETVARKQVKPQPSRRTAAKRAESRTASAPAATSRASAYDPRAWRSGVPGRIIQLGAFATSAQAQSEWRRVYLRYPLLRPLSPRVIKSRIRGRTYYRLQLGTFSQAHSELLCQRLRATGEGCIVLGLSARGTRR